MVFLELVEGLAVFLLIGLTVTQVIVPIVMTTNVSYFQMEEQKGRSCIG